jgi:hypothetical protein
MPQSGAYTLGGGREKPSRTGRTNVQHEFVKPQEDIPLPMGYHATDLADPMMFTTRRMDGDEYSAH